MKHVYSMGCYETRKAFLDKVENLKKVGVKYHLSIITICNEKYATIEIQEVNGL